MSSTLNPPDRTVDLTGLRCPHLLFAVIDEMKKTSAGAVLQISADDLNAPTSISAWVRQSGHDLLDLYDDDHTFTFRIRCQHNQHAAANPTDTLSVNT